MTGCRIADNYGTVVRIHYYDGMVRKMISKNGTSVWSDLLAKGLLIGLGVAGVKWLMESQQRLHQQTLKDVAEVVGSMTETTVEATSEALVATIKGPQDSPVPQVKDQPDNDIDHERWTMDREMEEFDQRDWTDYSLGVTVQTDGGNRVAGIEPGAPLIPGIPRPDLSGEEYDG